jgi:outer membrane biosynthesis protein TonB
MDQTKTAEKKENLGKTSDQIKASFTFHLGGSKKTLLIHKSRVVVGSIETADVRLSEASGVSPIHAVIELNFGMHLNACSARVLDLSSPTGVWVNGQRVVHEPIENGDSIKFGEIEIRFEFTKPEQKNELPDQALLLIEGDRLETIFDYRPSGKDTLETVYSWNESILDVDHLVDQNVMTVPAVYLNGQSIPIASKSGNRWMLNLDSKMTGVVYQNGELRSIQDLKKSGQTIGIGPDDFAKIDTGTISFYLSQTLAPPVLRKRRALASDPFLAKTMLGSVIATLLLLFAASKVELPPEPVQVSETITTIIYKPEDFTSRKVEKTPKPKVEQAVQKPEPEKPKKSEIDFTKPKQENKIAQTKSAQPGKKQVAQSQAKEGEGARAKGAEGSRGEKNARPSNSKQTAAKRPSPEAGEGRGGTQSEVADNGNLQMLKGATSKLLNLLGGSGQKTGKSGSKLSGFGGFSSEGNGGLALAGSGKGGGGNADTLLGGLGDKGRGGGKVGTGLGAVGTGSSIVGEKTLVLDVGGGEETVVVGSIDRDAIDAAIQAHRDEFRYCYEREINAGAPKISGKVITAFAIGASGKASQLAIASSTVNNSNVDRCVLGVLGRIQFPLPAGGVSVSIKYPFNFANTSK